MHGIRGNCYKEKKYITPKMQIGKLIFWNISMNEESDEFVKTPLYTDRGLVELVLEGPNGVQRWTLDTGATWNMINTDCDNQTLEDIALDPTNQFEATIKIEDQTFGPMPFHKLPFRLPIHINGMLGIEFFKIHQVFIDFSENQIYIRRSIKSERGFAPQSDFRNYLFRRGNSRSRFE